MEGACEENLEKCLPFIPLFGKIISVLLDEAIIMGPYEAKLVSDISPTLKYFVMQTKTYMHNGGGKGHTTATWQNSTVCHVDHGKEIPVHYRRTERG